MATVNETRVDAAASADTSYSMTPGDTFTGRLGERFDEDWVRIELQEGLTYEISLTGNGADGTDDTILRIYNSAGVQVAMNDDVDLAAGNLFSMLDFTPESSGTYYISAGGIDKLTEKSPFWPRFVFAHKIQLVDYRSYLFFNSV